MDMPAPDFASTPAELLAAMRALRKWAALTYRDLELKAQAVGEKLPRALIPKLMANNDLPRESTLASFVRACVGEEAVEAWLAARRRIVVGSHMTLAEEVDVWLTSTSELPQVHPVAYADGRLAEAVANSRGDRWVGLHRRRGGFWRKKRRVTDS